MSFGMNAPQDFEIQSCPTEPISSLAWSPSADLLGAGCWDKCAYVWNVQKQIGNDQAKYKADGIGKVTHNAPVLSVAFSKDNIMFSGSCDGIIKMHKVGSTQTGDLGKHDSGVKALEWCDQFNLLMSASWDKTIKYWSIQQGKSVLSVNCPERVYAARVRDNMMICGCADKKLYIFDLKNPNQPVSVVDSPLKYHTKSLAIFPDKKGYAVGSIEGRIHLNFLEEKTRTFTFKCHRKQIGSNQNSSEVYAVNSLDFHPIKGSFASAGSDGAFHIWCKESKTRLLKTPERNLPISDAKWSREGDIYAYTQCYDFSKGYQEYYQPNQKAAIFLHYPKREEIEPKRRTN